MGASFSASLIGGANGGQGSCSGRPCAPKHHRHWSNRLFSGHSGLFNQDDSTVGRLTSADVEKAENAKRKDTKQHKQVVTNPTILISVGAFVLCVLQVELLCFSSVREPERGRCPSHGSDGWWTLEVGFLQSCYVCCVRSKKGDINVHRSYDHNYNCRSL